jgi:hypothetical protein
MLLASHCLKFAGQDIRATRGGQGVPMKIYLLMVLIGVIAAISHLDLKRKTPEPKI